MKTTSSLSRLTAYAVIVAMLAGNVSPAYAVTAPDPATRGPPVPQIRLICIPLEVVLNAIIRTGWLVR